MASIAYHSKYHCTLLKMAGHILFLALLALTSSFATASDPSPLQDFCVADKTSAGNLTCFIIAPTHPIKIISVILSHSFLYSRLKLNCRTACKFFTSQLAF